MIPMLVYSRTILFYCKNIESQLYGLFYCFQFLYDEKDLLPDSASVTREDFLESLQKDNFEPVSSKQSDVTRTTGATARYVLPIPPEMDPKYNSALKSYAESESDLASQVVSISSRNNSLSSSRRQSITQPPPPALNSRPLPKHDPAIAKRKESINLLKAQNSFDRPAMVTSPSVTSLSTVRSGSVTSARSSQASVILRHPTNADRTPIRTSVSSFVSTGKSGSETGSVTSFMAGGSRSLGSTECVSRGASRIKANHPPISNGQVIKN